MNWINPKDRHPEEDQLVWIMLKPHKNYGTFRNSAGSIMIVNGEYHHGSVENWDGYGYGCQTWALENETIGWLPIDEMIYPMEKP